MRQTDRFRAQYGDGEKGHERMAKALAIQRLEAFESAQAFSKDVIRDAIWTMARSSERWLLYQKTFASSLAVMSIVGYFIGLGDRHLHNLLFEKSTGIVVHIDFGFIFEEARRRAVCPETVPFRATPALGVACGPYGFNGAFRRESERTLARMGQNEDSIKVVLDLFRTEPVRGAEAVFAVGRSVSAHVTERQDANERIEEVCGRFPTKSPGEIVGELIQQAADPRALAAMRVEWIPWV
jgi:phosphatidylinositol kinase/protein kinase (PI-3  family)